MIKEMPYYKKCYVCGRDNPQGLRQKFNFDTETQEVFTYWTPHHHHVGYENIVHGGLFLTFLDEVMAWAAIRDTKQPCLTVKMEIEFLKKAPYGKKYYIGGKVIKKRKRLVFTESYVKDEDGEIYYKSKATYIVVKDEKFLDKFEGDLPEEE